jgi:C-terminal processing protease CtpA/Prc
VKRRKETKPLEAKMRGEKPFAGKLIVLIDSRSGSASEVFSRVMQLEKRGTVIGDVSSGAVMRSRRHEHKVGVDTVVYYGASITDADVIMSDGKSLERVGVTPDVLKVPTAADLVGKLDPVLAYAASLVGVPLTPEAAGGLFPVEWRKDQ